jgi:hypothetical protein
MFSLAHSDRQQSPKACFLNFPLHAIAAAGPHLSTLILLSDALRTKASLKSMSTISIPLESGLTECYPASALEINSAAKHSALPRNHRL